MVIGVTSNPTAEWIAGQVTDAFPWDEAPRHLIRYMFPPGRCYSLSSSSSDLASFKSAVSKPSVNQL